jgi:hypothetical protein
MSGKSERLIEGVGFDQSPLEQDGMYDAEDGSINTDAERQSEVDHDGVSKILSSERTLRHNSLVRWSGTTSRSTV